jgi:hypothetical protein
MLVQRLTTAEHLIRDARLALEGGATGREALRSIQADVERAERLAAITAVDVADD